MDGFACDMKIEGLGAVQSGKNLTLKAVIQKCGKPVEYIELYVPLAGIRERFKKISDNEFSMEMTVPYGGRGFHADVRFTAAAPGGEKSAVREEKVVVG